MNGAEVADDWKQIGTASGAVVLVDAQDYEYLSQFKWCLAGKGYAHRALKKGKFSYMHREIMGNPAGRLVDHINHDILDNRRSNLRICDISQNNANMRKTRKQRSSLYKGVSWCERDKRWLVFISFKGLQTYVGCFKSENDAAIAYNAAAIDLHGKFALLNEVQA